MMGEPGSYDASVYDHFEDKDQEGLWFVKRYGTADLVIHTVNVCLGEPLPAASDFDGFVLAGSYNSVHDDTDWQREVLDWLPRIRRDRRPLLGICGSHQLLGVFFGAEVVPVSGGAYAGTLPVQLTGVARDCPLMDRIGDRARFHFANGEQVASLPEGADLLAFTEEVPVAAMSFGDHWYSTQFHPEATAESLGTIWRHKAPHLRERYDDGDDGDRLVENFLDIARRLRYR